MVPVAFLCSSSLRRPIGLHGPLWSDSLRTAARHFSLMTPSLSLCRCTLRISVGANSQVQSLSRTQLPIALAWAITIHKSQGATYSQAVVNLGEKEIALGLTYVAFSRVRTLDGLLLRGCYGMDRIMRLNLHPKHGSRTQAEEWLDSLPSNL